MDDFHYSAFFYILQVFCYRDIICAVESCELREGNELWTGFMKSL